MKKKLTMKKKRPKARVFTPKQKEQLQRTNSHRRQILCLTPKQVIALVSSLRSTAGLRSEKDRLYFNKIIDAIKEQTA